MKALLLAAGFGTRLRPITDHVPKCLVPVGGRPLLGYWLEQLAPQRFDEIVINTHYLPEAVDAYVRQSPHANRIRLVAEPTLLGTAGTLRANGTRFRNGSFLVAHADNLVRFDVEAMIARHESRPVGVEITMMTFDTDRPNSCGIVEENHSGIVTAFHEKVANPPGKRANGAVYLMTPGVIDFLDHAGRKANDISLDVLPEYLGRIQTWHDPMSYLRDIGTPESLAAAEVDCASLWKDNDAA